MRLPQPSEIALKRLAFMRGSRPVSKAHAVTILVGGRPELR